MKPSDLIDDEFEDIEAEGVEDEIAPKKKKREKKNSPMDEAAFQTLVTTAAQDGAAYITESISAEREQATHYYKGRLPDVDKETDEEDRSTAVLTEVRDVTLAMIPDLMRIFFSADGVCRYTAIPTENPEEFEQKEQEAAQVTDYVQRIVLGQDNPDAFMTFHDAFQDALVRKTGFIKYWWEKLKRPVYKTYTGLDIDTLTAIVGDDDEVVSKRAYPNTESAALGSPSVLYDVKIKCIEDHGKIRLAAVPCENIIMSRKGRSLDRPPMFGYTEEKTLSDFVAMGFKKEELDDCDDDATDEDNPEAMARRNDNTAMVGTEQSTDKTQRKIKYAEVYIVADKDGDGVDELIRCVCAGTKFKVLEDEPCEEIQYAAFCPYPEAHVFFGDSVADLTMDVQRIKSRVLRDILDSLAQSVEPATSVVEGQVNLEDVLNPDRSKVIRMRAPGMVQPHIIPFVGKEGLPILDLMSSVREQRTGMSDASQGLDPDILQSTTQSAVTSTLSKAQSRIEMVARIFAETGMKRLFRGILKLATQHQDKARTVALRGKWVQVEPSKWSPEMQVEVDVPLGRGSQPDQLAFLQGVASKQELILSTLGPTNPLVTLQHYFYTLKKITELAGWRNVDSFFGDPSKLDPAKLKEVEDAMKQAGASKQPAGPAAPDPAIEQMKLQSAEKIESMKLQFAQLKLQTEAQIEGMKIQSDAQMRALEIQANATQTITQGQIDATIKGNSDRIKAETAILVEKLKPRGGADKGSKSDGE